MADDYPSDLRYTTDHEWVRDDGEVLVMGITSFAQEQLGDVVYVDLPSAGAEVEQGQAFGEVESTKSVSDLFAPVSGTVVERNDDLDDRPEVVNTDPYGDGWMVTIRPSDRGQFEQLLDVTAYRASLDG